MVSALAVPYPVIIGSQLIEPLQAYLSVQQTVLIITDHTVRRLYGEALCQGLQDQGYCAHLYSFPPKERAKTLSTYQHIINYMVELGCDRHTVLVALGGGVVGDMVGFVAATYMRGIAYIQWPTTLLAMVDSSVGGKTALNTRQAKNSLGAFWSPQAVVMELEWLQSLPRQQLINGLMEAIKIFITHDRAYFDYVQQHLPRIFKRDRSVLATIVERAVHLKAAVVQQDEREQHSRKVLNFGHTIGHALEHLSHYRLRHGYAVAYGLLIEVKIACLLGVASVQVYDNIAAVLAVCGIQGRDLQPYRERLPDLLAQTRRDKKAQQGQAHYVLLSELGCFHQQPVQTQAVADAVVAQAFTEVLAS